MKCGKTVRLKEAGAEKQDRTGRCGMKSRNAADEIEIFHIVFEI